MTGTRNGATERLLLKDHAYAHIKDRIVDGTFAPGTFISEKDLAAELQMSKTPIRSAFERLSEQGFVTIAPQRGVIVREMSPREISEHFDLRIALETFVAREIAGRLTPAQVEAIEANLALQERQVTGELDVAGWTASDAEFHLLLASCLDNAEIIRTMTRQRDRLQRVVESIAYRDAEVPFVSYREHRAIYEAVRDGDREAAVARTEQHLQHGKRFLLLGGTYGLRPSATAP